MTEKRIVIDFSPKTIILIILTVLALWLVVVVREVLVILFLSYIFAAAVDPLIDRLEKRKIPRAAGILLVYLVIIGILALFFRFIVPPTINQITHLVQNSSEYVDKISVYVEKISPTFRDQAIQTISSMGKSISGLNSGEIVSRVFGVFSGAVGLISVFVIGFYLLVQKNGLEKGLAAILPLKYHDKAFIISRRVSAKMSSWVRGQLFLAFIIFLVIYIGLSILKVDLALTLAIISGILELLPIIGPIIAGTLATLVALTVSPLVALIVAAYYVLIQQLENHILVPQIMKKSVGLNPIIVIVAILVGGKLMGILGILIAVPVFAAMSVVFEELRTKS